MKKYNSLYCNKFNSIRINLRSIFIIIVLGLGYVNYGYGQDEQGHLELCRYGKTKIDIEIPQYSIIEFYDQSGNQIGSQQINTNNSEVFIETNFPENVTEGYYLIRSPLNSLFEGTFTIIYCFDELVFDTSCSKYILDDFNQQNDFILAKTICIGDTTEFFVVNADKNKSNPILPFTLDRAFFTFLKGKIISYDSISFKVLWEKPGVDILHFGEFVGTTQHYHTSFWYFNVIDTSKIIINNLSGTNELCLNETLNLELNSNNDINPIWEISDGRVLSGFSNQIDFHKPGDYVIKIFDDKECSCTPPTEYHVKVNSGTSPKIVCKRTVCVGETVTYYSSNECNTYLWNVSSEGTIIEGGGSKDFYITVQWKDGPVGEIKLATPSCISDVCDEETKEAIYIITPTLSITGQDTVCRNAISKYSIPDFTGTNFYWSVSNNAIILQGQNTNTIYVQWLYNNKGKVAVEYNNCNTGCSGAAEMDVDILGNLDISTSGNFCYNSTVVFYSSVVDWKVVYPDGTVKEFSNQNSLALLTDQIGKYNIIAINKNKNTCNGTAEYSFEIKINIPMPTDIEGSTFTCLFRPSSYTIPNLLATQNVKWSVFENGISKNFEGKNLNYTWTSTGPYKIQAMVFDPFTGCKSLPFEKEFFNDVNLIGNDTVCLFSTETYKLNNYEGDIFSVYLNPVNGNYSLVNTESDSISVIWNAKGKYTIQANACGVQVSKNIVVVDNPKYTLNFTDNICYESTSLLKVSPNSAEQFTLTYEDESKDVITLPKHIAAGKYSISYKDKNGCEYYEKFTINERKKSAVSLSLRNDYYECKPFDPYYLQANILPGTYTFDWYKNAIPTGNTNSFMYANDFGVYHVIATDVYGCHSKSDSLILYEYCPVISGGGGGGSPGGGGLPLIPKVSGCKDLTFELVPPFDSLNAHWYVGKTKIGTGTNITHTFDKVGKFTVYVSKCELTFDVKGNPIATCTTVAFDIVINFIPEFEIEPGCINTPTKFLNKTQFLYPNTISYLWNFDDAASGVNNTSTLEYPIHTYTKPGKYTVTLTVTDTSGCAITVVEEVEIYPDLDLKIISDTIACFGNQIEFYMDNTNSHFTYEWNFGDKNSYADNYSKKLNPSHNFSGLGSYNVILSAKNDRGCAYSTTKTITITSILEDIYIIASDNVKCPNDTVTLKTNKPFYKYKWSTGDTTATIKVVEPNQYIVTVYNEAGCSKVSSSKLIQDHYIVNTTVFAQERDLERSLHFDSITICKGDSFDLKCREVAGGSYIWSNGHIGNNVLKYETYFKNLNPGRYKYYVKVKNSECEYTTDKFLVIILGLPDKPIISSNTNNCENQETVLTIDNYDNTHEYLWNNGDKNKNTTVYSSGKYVVAVTNEFGCRTLSDDIIIHPIPKVNGWMTGCMDVCFPREFCLNLPMENTYHLLHDGNDAGILTATGGIANFNEPGDYQIEASNAFGCKTMTDILTLTALPVDQSLSGIVYLDLNNNDFFDSTDIRIKDGRLWLMNGNTIIDETDTDTAGYYFFDSLTQNNLQVVLDPISVPYEIKNKWDSLLIYKTCIEDKSIDFPLTKNCITSITQQTFFICKGESIFINGKMYDSPVIDSFAFLSQLGCDSILKIEIVEFPISDIDIQSKPSCKHISNGTVQLVSVHNEDLLYGLSQTDLSQNPIIQDLSEGTYTLYYKNNFGCMDSQLFVIDEILQPNIGIETVSSCIGDNTGKLIIDNFGDDHLIYQINNNGSFTNTLEYNNLYAGNHILSFMDQYGCPYEMDFEVQSFEKAIYNVESHHACFNQNNGIAEIIQANGSTMKYSLNNKNNFIEVSSLQDLAPDNYILYSLDENGCNDSIEFTIWELPKPQFAVEMKDACENENNGQIKIISSELLKFSINDKEVDSALNFFDLQAGTYLLSVKTKENCKLDTNITIASLPLPKATANSVNTCDNVATGEINLTIDASSYEISIDGFSWTNEKQFKNLAAGSYLIKIKDENNCELEMTQVIESFPPLIVEMPILNNECFDEATTILPMIVSHHGSINYQWNDGSTTPQLVADRSGHYEVTISDVCDTRSLETEMDITVYDENNVLNTANVFYPGSTIGNNCFKPALNTNYEFTGYLFSIYDRWGNLVFNTHSTDDCWDGTIKSVDAEQDVYVFVIDAIVKRCRGFQPIKRIGDVTLIR